MRGAGDEGGRGLGRDKDIFFPARGGPLAEDLADDFFAAVLALAGGGVDEVAAEADSARLTAIAERQELPAMVSHLVETELWSALIAKELARLLPRGVAQAALNRYRQSLADGFFAGVAVNARVQEVAEDAVQRCARGRNGFALRAMDALHLGTALVARCDCLVTTDMRQRQGAVLLGLKTLPD